MKLFGRTSKKDWRDYPGRLVTEKARAAARDRNWPLADDVVRETEETLARQINDLARRVTELEKRSVG